MEDLVINVKLKVEILAIEGTIVRIRIKPSHDLLKGDTIAIAMFMVLRKDVYRGFTSERVPIRVDGEDECRRTRLRGVRDPLVLVNGRRRLLGRRSIWESWSVVAQS